MNTRLLSTVLVSYLFAAAMLPGYARAAWIHDGQGHTSQPYAGWAANSDTPAPNANITIDTDTTPCNTNGVEGLACSTGIPGFPLVTIHETKPNKYYFYHELGHAFDYTMMTNTTRYQFLKLIGTPSRPWGFGDNLTTDINPPVEQFADAYKVCALYGPNATADQRGNNVYGYYPSAKTNKKVCELITLISRHN